MIEAQSLPERAFAPSDLSRRNLQSLLEAGSIERISRGLYRRTDLPPTDLDLAEIAAKSELATICLASALAKYELIDEIPSRIDLAIPRTARLPKTDAPIRWHRFDPDTFELGRLHLTLDGEDSEIAIYSAERSIVDAFRLRGQAGYEMANEALKNWLNLRGSHPVDLIKIAEQLPRATQPLASALSILT